MGIWGLTPEKFFKSTPSRMSENAHLEEGIEVAVTIYLCAQKGNCSLFLLSYFFSPMLEAKAQTSSPKGR